LIAQVWCPVLPDVAPTGFRRIVARRQLSDTEVGIVRRKAQGLKVRGFEGE
jgi:hypothetical protein